jgi:hydrogenase/urease accessory protein HupE
MVASILRIIRSYLRYRWVIAPVLCVVAALAWNVPIRAHEPGTTRVSVLFVEGRSYDIEIVTDAQALAEKLEAAAGRSLPADASPARLQALLQGSEETFRRRVKIAFDTSEVRPAISYVVTPPADASSATAATLRLTGDIPPAARHFTWTYAWTFASYSIAVRNSTSEKPESQWLEGDQTSTPFTLAAPPTWVDRVGTAWRYLSLGISQIVPNGLDHMLFVLGIYVLSGRARSMLWQIGAFTLAHSIALGLSASGVVAVSPAIVEPLIALSIAYVAIENIVLSELKSWRVALVFAFGLFHGLGFATALNEPGLPRVDFVTALLTFNAGIEVGQVAVIGAAFVLVGWHCANRVWYRSHIVLPASTLIACTAVYRVIERLSL